MAAQERESPTWQLRTVRVPSSQNLSCDRLFAPANSGTDCLELSHVRHRARFKLGFGLQKAAHRGVIVALTVQVRPQLVPRFDRVFAQSSWQQSAQKCFAFLEVVGKAMQPGARQQSFGISGLRVQRLLYQRECGLYA